MRYLSSGFCTVLIGSVGDLFVNHWSRRLRRLEFMLPIFPARFSGVNASAESDSVGRSASCGLRIIRIAFAAPALHKSVIAF